MITTSRRYNVDSRLRLSGTHTNFEYSIDIPDNRGFNRVVLTDFQIRKSWYVVPAGYNTITLVEGGVSTTVTIPPGNYNVVSWQNIIPGLLNAASPNHWVYSISYPNAATQTQTLKFTYTVAGNGSQPSLVFTKNVVQPFGFEEHSTNVFVANQLVSTTCICFQSEDQIYFRSSISSEEADMTLQALYVANIPDGGSVVYHAADPYLNAKNFVHPGSNNYRFWLTSEDGTPVDSNGLNCVFTLQLFKMEKPLGTYTLDDVIR